MRALLPGQRAKDEVVDLLCKRHCLQDAAPFVREGYRVSACVLFCATPF